MRVLIVGSRGFIGSHCAAFFSDRGHYVHCADVHDQVDDRYTRVSSLSPDFSALFADGSFDVCINASGSANVSYSFKHPDLDYELNTLNVHRILVAIRRDDPSCRLINFSSAAVYGNPATLPIAETGAKDPLSPYGFHKLQSEHLLREYSRFFGLRTCSLRVFSAYGPGLRKQLFWDLHRKAQAGNTVELFGSGQESRDFIFITDLCRAIDLVIEKTEFRGEALNVATGIEVLIRDAVDLFFEAYDPGARVRFTGAARVGDPNNWRADISRITALGFSPNHGIRDGIREYVTWLRESG